MSSKQYRNIAVIGGGTIGASWSALFLAKGLNVTVCDPAPDAEPGLKKLVQNAWPALQQLGVATADVPWAALSFTDDINTAVGNADFVQENAPEKLDFKIDLFAQMDQAAPADTILASSSSGLIMSQIQSQCNHPERCVIGHPFNPPHLIPLIEVVGGQKTTDTYIDQAMDFYRLVGKSPIRINKEVTGHIANRLQAALWREAIYLAVENVASLEDIDKAISEGPGLRWAIFGPHMTFNLGGGQGGMAHFIDHLKDPVQSWWDSLGDADLEESTRQILLKGLADQSAGRTIDDLVTQRDQTLLRILAAKYS